MLEHLANYIYKQKLSILIGVINASCVILYKIKYNIIYNLGCLNVNWSVKLLCFKDSSHYVKLKWYILLTIV